MELFDPPLREECSMPALGYVLALLASVLWGLTYCLDERVLAGMSVTRLYFLH